MPIRAVHAVKAALRPVRDNVNRLLHPWHRRRVRHRLHGLRPVRVIVFVCLGNICRSPYAAERFRQLAAVRGLEGIDARSAGFIGPGRASPPEAQAVARQRGVDLSGHKSRTLERRAVKDADLLVVMTPGQAKRLVEEFRHPPDQVVVLGDLDPRAADRRAIPDPWGKPFSVFEASFDRIDRCLEELVHAMGDEVDLLENTGQREGTPRGGAHSRGAVRARPEARS